MAQPAIGDWDTTGDTPITQKSEDARRQKQTGISSHPNDPRRNPEAPRKSPLHPSAHTSDPRDQKPKNPPHAGRPETDSSRPTNVPHQQRREQGGNAGPHRSPYRTAAGAASPLQPTNPAKPKHKSAGMQTPERRASLEGHGPHTPGRGRRKHEAPEDEVTVPPFGDWDDSNAASGDKYTGIFNRMRNDKLSPNSSVKQSSSDNRGQAPRVQQTCPCCIL